MVTLFANGYDPSLSAIDNRGFGPQPVPAAPQGWAAIRCYRLDGSMARTDGRLRTGGVRGVHIVVERGGKPRLVIGTDQ